MSINAAPLPVTYISFPSAKDPDWERRYPGRSTVEVITLSPFEWFAEWQGTRWMKRGDTYEAFKAEYTERRSKRLVDTISSLDVQITQNCETLLDTEFPELLVRGDTLNLMKTVLSYQHVRDTPSDPYNTDFSYLMIPIMISTRTA